MTAGGAAASDLQLVIDAASAGDVLEVQGTCLGGFVVTKALTVRSRLPADPAVLDGNGIDTVMTVIGVRGQPTYLRLNLRHLVIQNGRGQFGGAISAQYTDLWLTHHTVVRNSIAMDGGGGVWAKSGAGGRTVLDNSVVRDNKAPGQTGGGIWTNGRLFVHRSNVVGNSARLGGGIFTSRFLRLNGDSYVGGNRAQAGGGIVNEGGGTWLEMHAHVAHNESYAWGGGGIDTNGHIRLKDAASVRGNVASSRGPKRGDGAGIRCRSCIVSLSQHASIANNISATRGGGIAGYGTIRLHKRSEIRGNRAVRGAGVFLGAGETLRLDGRAKILGNTADARGGGVYAERYRDQRARIILSGEAAIAANRPDNVYREDR